ncbi:ABC transporter substrate-binding protein [Leucobacter sp. M11]|uniref:ABC transporter substrate-binding protein n=1 Tax=Leucobacter sp. M11 TaxID=2993565 RepID=UPI002D7EEEA5|nr:ABC transporter substrate-binding protein [Leucobacter sp. M11]MEB4613683.1 ABC transporter substrate-binding protein [Leucobacter sp. M11]
MQRHGTRATTPRAWAGAAGLAALAIAMTGCVPLQYPEAQGPRTDVTAAPGSETLQEGGDLVMALSSEPDKLDPTTSTSLYTRFVMSSMCEKLYDIDASGEIVPQLATELPEISADGRTVTIPVRTGAVFSDGTPFNAEAVRTTFERNLTLEGSGRKTELGPIERVTAPDATTVVVEYDTPFAPLTAALADRAGMILSPTALADESTPFADAPSCVGPFSFVERIPQTSITLEKDPNYYAADEVHLDTITYRIMSDANIRAANLRSGDVHVADAISPQDADALLLERDLELLQTGSLGYQGLTVNIGNANGTGQPVAQREGPLAADPRVRQALTMSIDRPALVNSVFNNWYDPACSPISPNSPFASEASTECVDYDPEGAQALLAEAGVEIPLRVELMVANSPDALRYSQALQASVRKGGFDLRIQPVEYSTLLDMQKQGKFDLMQIGWSGRIDPHGNTATFLTTGAGNNDGGYSSPEMDDLLTRAAQLNGVEERAKLYGEAVELIHRDNPLIYTYRQRNITAHTVEVSGVRTYTDGVVRLSRAGFVADKD